MTVAEMSELRGLLRNSDVEYTVIKNTLARLAASDTPAAAAAEFFTGPVGLALGYEDAVLAPKGVFDYARKNGKLKVQGGVVDGMYYAGDELMTIAALPSKEVLLGMLAGAMASPMSMLASALAATVSRFGHAMAALKSKKEAE